MKLRKILIAVLVALLIGSLVIVISFYTKDQYCEDYVGDEEIFAIFEDNQEAFEIIRDYMMDKEVDEYGCFYLSQDKNKSKNISDVYEKLYICGFGNITKRYSYYPCIGVTETDGFYIEFRFLGKTQENTEKYIRWIKNRDINGYDFLDHIKENWYLYSFYGT